MDEPTKINFHFIKSADHRVIHVDGAAGSITPHGYIQMTLYAERAPIPQRTTHLVKDKDGNLSDEITDERIVRDGPVRDCEVTAIMDRRTTEAIRDWLTRQLDALDAVLAKSKH